MMYNKSEKIYSSILRRYRTPYNYYSIILTGHSGHKPRQIATNDRILLGGWRLTDQHIYIICNLVTILQ